MNGKLIVSEGGRDKIHEICEDVVVVGRGPAAGLHLRDPGAAPQHCEVRRTPKGFKVVDLETATGTTVNGKPVNQHLLQNGDTIGIGGVRITFLGDSAGAPAKPRRPAQVVPPKLPTDEEGRPRRYYRHEVRARSNTSQLVTAGLILLGIVVVIVLVVQLGGTEYRTDATKAKDEIRALLDQDTPTAVRKAYVVLKDIPSNAMGDEEREQWYRRIKLVEEGQKSRARLAKEEEEFQSIRAAVDREAIDLETLRRRIRHFADDFPDSTYLPKLRELEKHKSYGSPELYNRWQKLKEGINAATRHANFPRGFELLRQAESDPKLTELYATEIAIRRTTLESRLGKTFEGLVERLKTAGGEDRAAIKVVLEQIAALSVAPWSSQARDLLERMD